MPQLRINLLGPPQVQWDQTTLVIPRKMLRAMLFYLACQPAGVGRAELLPLFWPNMSEEDARRRLRTALSKLRTGLPDPSLLVTSQDEVGLDFRRVIIDVRLYRELGQRSYEASLQFPIHNPLPEGIFSQMVRAATLWRSSRFLAGASLPTSAEFDRWLSSLGQMLESSRMALLSRLAYHSEATGDLEAALMWARPYLQINELDEDLQAHVISWLIDLGRRSEALSYCTHIQALFHEEGGGALPPVLVQAIKKAHSVQRSLPGEADAWLPELPAGAAFVGRGAWMEDLRLAFRRGGVVCLGGEAGAGKTRLLFEFYHSLNPEPLLLLGKAGQSMTALPFHPLVGALRSAVKEKEWSHLDPLWLQQLVQLLPELARYLPESGVRPSGLPQDALPLYEALHQLLISLAHTRRVLFVLENAHACDQPTLAALAYLVEQGFFNRHGLLALAYRPEEPSAALASWLETLSSRHAPVALNLAPLDEPAVRELVLTAFHEIPSPDLVPNLLRSTGGNPQFLIETIQALLELTAHAGGLDWLDRLPVASSLSVLLRERLRRVRPQSRQVLEMAAVIGIEFPLDLLETCVQSTPEQLVAALEELEQARLVAFAPDLHPAGGYTFVHAQVPQALLLELSPARRRLLHLRVARALELRPAAREAGAAELAQHYEAAGDLPASVEAWMRAARYDRRLFSPAEAYRAYAHAEQLVLRLGDQASEALLYQLYSAWGETAFELNDSPVQKQVYTTLLVLGEQRGSSLLAGAALSGLANAHFPAPLEDFAPDKIDQAIFYLRQAGNRRELAEAYHRRGTILMQLGRYPEAAQASGEAVEIACCEPALAGTYFGAALRQQTAYMLLGVPQQLKDAALKTLVDANRQGFSAGAAQAHMVLAWAECYLGSPAVALEHYALGRLLAESARLAFVRSYLLMMASQAELMLGHLDESWQHTQELIELGRRLSAGGMLFQAYFVQGLFFLTLGETARAEESFQLAQYGEPSHYELLTLGFARALVKAGLGQAESALQELDLLAEQARQSGLGYVFLPAGVAQAWLLASSGQTDRAEALLEPLEAELEQRSQRLLGVFSRLVGGLAAWQAGRPEEAGLACFQAIEAARRTGFVWGELLGYRLLARMGGPITPSLRLRVNQILEEIDRHVRQAWLVPVFARFCRSILALEE